MPLVPLQRRDLRIKEEKQAPWRPWLLGPASFPSLALDSHLYDRMLLGRSYGYSYSYSFGPGGRCLRKGKWKSDLWPSQVGPGSRLFPYPDPTKRIQQVKLLTQR